MTISTKKTKLSRISRLTNRCYLFWKNIFFIPLKDWIQTTTFWWFRKVFENSSRQNRLFALISNSGWKLDPQLYSSVKSTVNWVDINWLHSQLVSLKVEKRTLFENRNFSFTKKMQRLTGRWTIHVLHFEFLPHLAYSPDLAPIDFYLKKIIVGKEFESKTYDITETEVNSWKKLWMKSNSYPTSSQDNVIKYWDPVKEIAHFLSILAQIIEQ